MLEKIIYYFAEKKTTFSVSEGALLKTLELFMAKCFIIFFNQQWQIYFLSIWDFKLKNALMLSQHGIFYCKALTSPHAFLICHNKFSAFNKAK